MTSRPFCICFPPPPPKKRFLCDQRSHRLSCSPWVAFEGPKFKLPCWHSSLSKVWAIRAQVTVSFSLLPVIFILSKELEYRTGKKLNIFSWGLCVGAFPMKRK